MTSPRKLLTQRTALLALILTALAISMALLHTSNADAFPPLCCSHVTVINYYSDASKTVWVGQCIYTNECVGTDTCWGGRTNYFTSSSSCCSNCSS